MNEGPIFIGIVKDTIIRDPMYSRIFIEGRKDVHDTLLTKANSIVINILVEMFLEDPEEKCFCAIIDMVEEKYIEVIVGLEKDYYDKHIGKLIKEAREKLKRELVGKLVGALRDMDWETYIDEKCK